MTFWGEINGWSDLHSAVRTHLLCSCSQHSTADRVKLDDMLTTSILAPIRAELENVCSQLEEIRHEKGGKKATTQ